MKRTLVLIALCLLLSVLLMVWGFAEKGAEPLRPAPVYAMLLTEDKGTVVLQLKQGAQAAVEALDAGLTIYTAEPGLPQEGQLLAFIETMSRQENLAGLICPPMPEAAWEAARALADGKGIPLVALWEAHPLADIVIRTDDQAQSALFAEAVGGAIPVVLLEGTEREEARLLGLEQALGAPCEAHRGDAAQLRAVFEALPPDATVCVLSGGLTDALSGWDRGERTIYGMDPGESRVTMLSQGMANGLMMEMPYAQGYLAVMAASEPPRQNGAAERLSPSRMVAPDTMYEAENVKLVFPLLQ